MEAIDKKIYPVDERLGNTTQQVLINCH